MSTRDTEAGSASLRGASERALQGGPERHREKARDQGKLPVRERIDLLLDDGSFAEEALLANWQEQGLGADGVVTGIGTVGGRTVALMANDPTVKAGSWGPKTVEKILRVQERAFHLLGGADEPLARAGELRARRAPVEQFGADCFFERSNATADRRVVKLEPFGGSDKLAATRDSEKTLTLSQSIARDLIFGQNKYGR